MGRPIPEFRNVRKIAIDKIVVATNIVGNDERGEAAVARRSLQEEIKKRNPFDSPEEEAFLNLARTLDWHATEFTRLFKKHGISGSQYNVLRILRGEGTPLPCLEVASRMITKLPDITRLVDRLEDAGLVERSRTTEDRRLVLIRITDAGLGLLGRLDEPIKTLHRRQLGHLTREELAELNRLLVKARNPGGPAARRDADPADTCTALNARATPRGQERATLHDPEE
jgi:DNA-binding MarR family transcriptional regulator